MFLLVRDVSRYTEWDPILLGVFADEAKASEARLSYIAQTADSDPWKEQAYKTPNLEADVRVAQIESHGTIATGSPAYLVTRHLEGMGQFDRWYLAIYGTLEEAIERAATEQAEEQVVAEYISVEEFTPNRCYFDYASLPFVPFGTGLWNPAHE